MQAVAESDPVGGTEPAGFCRLWCGWDLNTAVAWHRNRETRDTPVTDCLLCLAAFTHSQPAAEWDFPECIGLMTSTSPCIRPIFANSETARAHLKMNEHESNVWTVTTYQSQYRSKYASHHLIWQPATGNW